jgi:nitrogen fixation protein FixH
MRAAKLWPIAIVGMLAVNVIATGVLMWAANDDEANAIESDYYRKAVAWDSTVAARERGVALGWSMDATLGTLGADGMATVAVTLADSAGAPLEGAAVTLEAIHNAHARHPLRATLTPSAPGHHEARLPFQWAGRWELRLEVARDGVRVPSSVRREAVRG